MNFSLLFNIPIPSFLNEENSLEIFDIDNDYNIINDLYNNEVSYINKHIYIINELLKLNWNLRKIFHSVISYYSINFEDEPEYFNYIKDSIKITIYYHYRNDILNSQMLVFDDNYDDDYNDNNNLLTNENELNIMKYKDVEDELRNKYNDCNICYNTFNDDIDVVLLDCVGNHIYCHNCIVEWLKNYNNSCPVCKN